MRYVEVMERDREELEILLRSQDTEDITNGLLSAAYYDLDWRWVQGQCLEFSHHADRNVRWVATTCFGHIARIHQRLDLELVLARLDAMREDPLVASAADDALGDIRFFLNFQ